MTTLLQPRASKLRIVVASFAICIGAVIASVIAAFLLGIGFAFLNSKTHLVNLNAETSAWLGVIAIFYGFLAGLVIAPIVSLGYLVKRLELPRRTFIVVFLVLLAVIPAIEYSILRSPTMVGAENRLNVEAVSSDAKLAIVTARFADSSILYLVDTGTGQARRLAASDDHYQDGAKFSADGKQVIFTSRKQSDSPSRIMLCNVDGSGMHPLLGGDDDDYAAMFSHDGKTIYFARDAASGRYIRDFDIYAVKVDGSDLRKVTGKTFKGDEGTNLLFPESISDNETELLLKADTTIGDRLLVYSLVDPDHAPEVIVPRIPNGPEHPVIVRASFAPGERNILFMAASQGAKGFDYDIYSFDIETYGVQKLTSVGGYASDFQLSSNGRVAVYFTWDMSHLNSVPVNPALQLFDIQTRTASPVRMSGLPSDTVAAR